MSIAEALQADRRAAPPGLDDQREIPAAGVGFHPGQRRLPRRREALPAEPGVRQRLIGGDLDQLGRADADACADRRELLARPGVQHQFPVVRRDQKLHALLPADVEHQGDELRVVEAWGVEPGVGELVRGRGAGDVGRKHPAGQAQVGQRLPTQIDQRPASAGR